MNEFFLKHAIQLAQDKMQANQGGPFGAVVVRQGEIVGQGWNQVTTSLDPTAHAEVVAIREACQQLGVFSLVGCEIYASCEPCPMCLAAIYWARLDRIYYAASCADAVEAGFDDGVFYTELSKPPALRKIPAQQALREEAKSVFAQWLTKPDRVDY